MNAVSTDPATMTWALIAGALAFALIISLVLKGLKPDWVEVSFSFLGGIRLMFKLRKRTSKVRSEMERANIHFYVPAKKPVYDSRELMSSSWQDLKAALRKFFDAQSRSGALAVSDSQLKGLLDADKLLDRHEAAFLRLLYVIGEEMMDKRPIPFRRDAIAYWELAESAVYWLEHTVIPKIAPRHEPEPAPAGRRATVVGGAGVFPSPPSGQPLAVLVATSGRLVGSRIPVTGKRFDIGAGPENDLTIPDDDFVSKHHAYLQRQDHSGHLLLFDADSRNGTFLNDERLTGAGTTVTVGNYIRIGETSFRVERPDGVSRLRPSVADAHAQGGEQVRDFVP